MNVQPVESAITAKLAAALDLAHLEVVNESNQHNVPAGSESHFKLVLVSEGFVDMRLVARHQAVYAVLADELAGPVHALAIHAYTASEWQDRHGEAPLSPPCLGGSVNDPLRKPESSS